MRPAIAPVIASEWHKLRTVRSTLAVLLFVVALIVVGVLFAQLTTNAFLAADPETRQSHASADVMMVLVPFTQLAVAALGALAITSEHSTGMIRSSMLATPRRGRLFAGKAVAVGGAATAIGAAASFLTVLACWFIAGDQPEPLKPWPTLADGMAIAAASTLSITVVAMVAFGLGTALRSTAGALMTVTGLVYVLPMISAFLPSQLSEWIMARTLLALPPQLADAPSVFGGTLSQSGAAVTLVGYVVVALGIGWVAMRSRDA